jgi:tetratricopeptide (TPR) repeat protein
VERIAERRQALAKESLRQLKWYGMIGGRSPNGLLLNYVARVLNADQAGLPVFPVSLQLSEVSTDDLLLAGTAFLGLRKLGLADPIVCEAYLRAGQRLKVLELICSVEYELGNDELVLAACQEWQQLDSQSSVPWLLNAFVYENRGKLHQVVEPLRQAIQRLPAPATKYRAQLVDYLVQLRQIGPARREFNALCTVDPEFPAESLVEARLLFAEGETKPALEMAEILVEAAPEDAALLALLGKIYLSLRNPSAGLPYLERLVELFPYEPEAQYLLGQALARLKRPAEAKVHLNQHRALIRAKTDIYKLQRQAGLEPHNLELRLELARLCKNVQWTEKETYWKQSADEVREAQDAAGCHSTPLTLF